MSTEYVGSVGTLGGGTDATWMFSTEEKCLGGWEYDSTYTVGGGIGLSGTKGCVGIPTGTLGLLCLTVRWVAAEVKPMVDSSDVVENGDATTATETGLGVFLLTVGRKTTGAVAARWVMKPGAKGLAVLFKTELAGSSGRGAGGGGITASAEVTEKLVTCTTEGAGAIVCEVSSLIISKTLWVA